MNSDLKVFIVDDDDNVRTSLARALEFSGYVVDVFESGKIFLDKVDLDGYGCLVLDVAMPGMSGLEVQSQLAEKACFMPIIFMTGHGDVPTSVQAIKNGAIEFLEKPFAMDLMLQRVEEAMLIERNRVAQDQVKQALIQKFATLTAREADVMLALVEGRADRSNKEVAELLNISPRTAEEYRARVLRKMGASSITHLAELAKACGVYES